MDDSDGRGTFHRGGLAGNGGGRRNADGSVTIQFGGDESAPSCIPIMPGWNYVVRMYRQRKEIPDGAWKFPEAQPVK